MSTRTANVIFWSMLKKAHSKGEGDAENQTRTIIGIDPGETTGFAFRPAMVDRFEVHMMQIDTKDRNQGADAIKAAIKSISLMLHPVIVCEDYRVYGHKSDQHKWAGLHTPKLIGHIERIAYELQIPIVFPMAIEGKSFATDEMLKTWDLYAPGERHARDASRHVVTRAFFGKSAD